MAAPLKAGQVQRTHAYFLYVLNAEGKIAEIKGPPPEIGSRGRQNRAEPGGLK